MKLKHSDKWYQVRLSKFFNERFSDFEEFVEWDVDPAINVWKFKIPALNEKYRVECNDDGKIAYVRSTIK